MDYLSLEKDIFYSIVNMKLRDVYQDLEDFSLSENIEYNDLKKKLKEFNLVYDTKNNRLVELL